MKSSFAKILLASISFVAILNCPDLSAQRSIEELMTRRNPECFDLMKNAFDLLPGYHSKQQIDSVNAVLDFWEDHCGKPEELIRFKVLLAIEQRSSYVDSAISYPFVLRQLMDYRWFALSGNLDNRSHNWHYRFPEIKKSGSYSDYTLQWANKMLSERNDLSPHELFFLRLYSHDFDDIFSMLRDEDFDNTEIQRQYNFLVASSTINTWFRGEISLGGWFPSENLSVMGNHAGFGIGGGVQHKRWHGILSIKAFFGNSQQPREVYHKDSLYVSDVYSHVSLTLDFGYALYIKNQHNLEVLGGVGYNGVKVLELANPVNTSNPESIYRNGLLLSAGLGYRYDFPLGTYLGLSAKFNFTHFNNQPGTDLTGNFLTIHFTLGLISQDYKKRNRQLLDLE